MRATGVELSGLYVDCVDKFTFFPPTKQYIQVKHISKLKFIQITLYFKIWANFEQLYIENTLYSSKNAQYFSRTIVKSIAL